VLAALLLGLYPSIPGGDSGELASAACATGVAHPPGYPLWTLLAKLTLILPLGTPGWRLNLLSALCTAGAAAILCDALRRATGRTLAGFVAGAGFGLSPLIFRYSIQAEVFALDELLAAGLLATALAHGRRPAVRTLYLGSLLIGLGGANHHTFALLAAPIGLWALFVARHELSVPVVAGCLGLLALGLLPYLYLPLAARHPPLETWGNTATLDGFLTHVLRREYGTFQLGLANATPRPGRAFALWAASLPRETLGVGLVLALAGVGVALRERRGPWLLFAAFIPVYLVVFFSLANLPLEDALFLEVQRRFWRLPEVVLYALAGLGAASLAPRLAWRPWLAPLACALWLGALGATTLAAESQRGNDRFGRFARLTLESLPERAVLATKGDMYLNTFRYAQACEGVRPDVVVLDRELLKAEWFTEPVRRRAPDVRIPGRILAGDVPVPGGYKLLELISAQQRPFFVSSFREDDDGSWKERYGLMSWGFLHRLIPKGTPIDAAVVDAVARKTIDAFDAAYVARARPGTWEWGFADAWFSSAARRAGTILQHALDHGKDRAGIERARVLLEEIERHHPEKPAAVLKDLGVAYYELRGREPALDERMRSVWRRYLATSPPPGPEVDQIRRLVDQR
jgi:hypothetical protein